MLCKWASHFGDDFAHGSEDMWKILKQNSKFQLIWHLWNKESLSKGNPPRATERETQSERNCWRQTIWKSIAPDRLDRSHSSCSWKSLHFALTKKYPRRFLWICAEPRFLHTQNGTCFRMRPEVLMDDSGGPEFQFQWQTGLCLVAFQSR